MSRRLKYNVREQGFTLVEALIYFSILIVMSVGAVTFLFSLQDLFAQYRVKQELFTAGSNVLERATTEIRTSEEVVVANSVIADPTAGAIALDDGAAETVLIFEGDAINVYVNGVLEGSLTSSAVTVEQFTVYHYPATIGETVRFKVTLTATVGSYSVTETFYGGALVRGDYD